METPEPDVHASMCAVSNIRTSIIALVEHNPIARLACRAQDVDRMRELTQVVISKALMHDDRSMMSAMCAWWRQVYATLAPAKPHWLAVTTADSIACAIVVHRLLTLGYTAINCASVGLLGAHLPATTVCDMELKCIEWFDTVIVPLQRDVCPQSPVDDVLQNILELLQCDTVSVFAHAIQQHNIDTQEIEEMLRGDSVDVTCARSLAASALELCAHDDLWPDVASVRRSRKALRDLDAALDGRAPAPEWLTQALGAIGGLAARAQRRALLHPAVSSTLQQQPECPVCCAPMDALDIVILPCWRPPPPHDDSLLHCFCGTCYERWTLTCMSQSLQEPTCPICRSAVPGDGVLHAEDDVASLLQAQHQD